MGLSILRGIGSPGSLGGLSRTRLGRLYTRVERCVVGAISRANKRLTSGLNIIRLAITLRGIFGDPASRVIFSINRRYCARGVLANHGSGFGALHARNNVDKFAQPIRDGRSVFSDNRSDISVSRTMNLTGTGRVGNRGNGMVTMVNSNTLANNLTCRTLSGYTNSSRDGLVIVLGSGGVSVDRGINDVSGRLARLHASGQCFAFGSGVHHTVTGVPGVNNRVGETLAGVGNRLEQGVCRGTAFFRSLNLQCCNPVSKRSVGRLVSILRATGTRGRSILIRIGAIGNGKCGPTRGGPARFRKVKGFSMGANRPLSNKRGFSSIFNEVVYSFTRRSSHVYYVATTVTPNAKLASFTGGCPGHFFSINVTRRRTIAFTDKLTGGKVVPIFTICSAFLRESCSRLVRSITVRSLGIVFNVSHTNFMNRSNRSRRNIFSISFLGSIPKLSICTPTSCRRVTIVFIHTVCGSGNTTTIHCPHKRTNIVPGSCCCSGASCSMFNSRNDGGYVMACNERFSRY